MASCRTIFKHFVVFIVSLKAIGLDACEEGRYGEDCDLFCRCRDGCVTDTGVCLPNSAECNSNWAGPTCQIELENVALGKSAIGDPVKKSNVPDFAVDGNTTSYTWLQNKDNETVYWGVDLGQFYTIHTINVAFYDPITTDLASKVKKRRPGFTLLVKKTFDEPGTICYQDNSQGDDPAASQSFTNCTYNSRYVFLENSRDVSDTDKGWSPLPNLEIVEVEVLVDTGCSNGSYGSQCDKHCGHCVEMQCDRKTAICEGECKDGFYGNSCNMTCPPGCPSKCLKSGICDGCFNNSNRGNFCNETCMLGCMADCFQNGTCRNDCESGFYGNMCDEKCNSCRTNPTCNCKRSDGKCMCGCTNTAYYGIFCNETCSSISPECVQCEGNQENGLCLGCNSSRYGDQCEKDCPARCAVCVNDQNCTECYEGFSGLTCKDSCKSDKCIHCDNDGYCIQCTGGLKGTTCEEQCDKKCETCEAVGGICTRCKDGNYLDKKRGMCLPCIRHCTKCTGLHECMSCNDGYYGNSCYECPSNCETCIDKENCLTCTNSLAGSKCLCSEQCNMGTDPGNVQTWCNETGGQCLIGCKDGFYTSSCLQNCTDYCSNCTLGDGRCLQCTNKRYGPFCESECGNCVNDLCDLDTGKCPRECADGNYGTYCNLTCSSKCDQSKCEKWSGNCSSCPSGWFGSLCESECNDQCDSCDQYTGKCIGCKNDTRFGPMCEETCGHCYNCNQTGYCEYCNQKFYGDNCSMSCPSNCGPDPWAKHTKTICYKLSGQCIFCKPGFYGSSCTEQCGSNCFKGGLGMEVCHMSNGDCLKCVPGFYGSHCHNQCNEKCASNKDGSEQGGPCNQQTGDCVHGCMPGMHGTDCSHPCNNTCNQGLCDNLTAACLGCIDGYKGVYCEQEKPAEADGSMMYIIIAIVAIVVMITVIAGLLYLRRKRRKPRKRESAEMGLSKGQRTKGGLKDIDRNSIVYTNLSNGHTQSSPVPAKKVHEMGMANGESQPLMYDKISDKPDPNYYNLDTRILVETFTEHLQRLKINNAIWFKEEFGKLPKKPLKDCTVAKSPGNRGKCRYQNLYPYDDNRVVLEPETNDTSDFINASYINGYKKPQAFIASQGPVDVNVNDFWRMIFQQDCGKIVIVTKLFEEGKLKCVRYWPELGEREEYGNYIITMVSETPFPDYVLRHFEAEHVETKEAKEFKQFHFTSWPDCGVPESPSSMLNFRDKVNEPDPMLPDGPILVHCSAGIGRTGTFIGLDYLLRQAQEEPYIDVFKTILDMRYQRTNFIQTNVQYEFLHNAISEALTTKTMEVSMQDFPAYYQSLLDVNDETGKTKLEEQFELLNKMSPTTDLTVCSAGNKPENVAKNRCSDILPVDTYRAYLSTPVKGSNEYINAVFLPTCSSKTGFLVTQMPLPQTVTDFWRLVCDQHVTHIVMMNNLNDEDDDEDMDVGEYWPSDDCTYGPFKIELLSCENNDDFSIMNMQLTYNSVSGKKTMTVRQFRFEGWPDDCDVPPNSKSLINLICEVSKSYRMSTDQSDEPIISHCMNGADRSGLYCVLSVILERLQSDPTINISQIILQLRSRRPQLIPTLEQFDFCYSAVVDYLNDLEASQIYSNVL